jgi:hypothetical protein
LQCNLNRPSLSSCSVIPSFIPDLDRTAIDAAAARQLAISAPALSWQMMWGLNFRTGKMTPELQGVINGVARVQGYMVLLEDNLEEVTEFLLETV